MKRRRRKTYAYAMMSNGPGKIYNQSYTLEFAVSDRTEDPDPFSQIVDMKTKNMWTTSTGCLDSL